MESVFSSSFVSSIAGAAFGALAAYVIARVSEIRKDRLISYRMSSNAVVLATTCANMAMSLKSQHVQPISRELTASQEAVETIHANTITLGSELKGSIPANLSSLTPLVTPIEALKNFVYTMNLSDPYAVAAVAQLEQSILELNAAIAMREALIMEHRQSGPMSRFKDLCWLLGLVQEDGTVDERYPSSVQAMLQYTNDVIFYSVYLAEQMTTHSQLLHRNIRKLRMRVPSPHAVDFSMARCRALIPEHLEYESWLNGMRKKAG